MTSMMMAPTMPFSAPVSIVIEAPSRETERSTRTLLSGPQIIEMKRPMPKHSYAEQLLRFWLLQWSSSCKTLRSSSMSAIMQTWSAATNCLTRCSLAFWRLPKSPKCQFDRYWPRALTHMPGSASCLRVGSFHDTSEGHNQIYIESQ